MKSDAKVRQLRIALAVVIVIAVVLGILLGTRSTKSAEAGGSSGSAEPAPIETTWLAAGEPLASVNGVVIGSDVVSGVVSMYEYMSYGMFIEDYYEDSANGMTEADYNDQKLISVNDILVNFFVPTEVLSQHFEYKDMLSDETKAEIEEEMANVYTDETATAELSAHGVTEEMVRFYLDSVALMDVFRTETMETNPVTDAEVQAFYDENPDYFVVPMSFEASHILIEDAEHTPEKLAEIEAILARVQAGEDFAELAKEYSEDSGSAANGGELGSFSEGDMVEPFEEACKALNPGEVSGIVETDYGYHIIKLTSKTDAGVTPVEDVSESIKEYLADEKATEALNALVDAADIEYFGVTVPETGLPPVSLEELAVAQ
ncbi:MAG: peptidylprolyl isomerase [Clostridiales Family XIII bacterium]|nr:peptidylprolyl isomerase [Clostridiales Family XIII bacterium]